MQIRPYELESLTFAWCHRVYCRWRTHRRRPHAQLAELDREILAPLLRPYGIHLLDVAADQIDVPGMNQERRVALAAEPGPPGKWKDWVRGGVSPRRNGGSVQTTSPRNKQDRRAGTLQGCSLTRMGFEPAVVSERPSGPPG